MTALQIAVERSQPGPIMSGYNKIYGDYASGNHPPEGGFRGRQAADEAPLRYGATRPALDLRSIVLLRNDGVLPLGTDKPLKIAVIDGHVQGS